MGWGLGKGYYYARSTLYLCIGTRVGGARRYTGHHIADLALSAQHWRFVGGATGDQ